MKKICVFDDDKDFLLVLKSILQLHNYEVVGFDNTNNFLPTIESIIPDIIFMDHSIGSISGDECIKSIKNSKFSHIPIILFSGNADIRSIKLKSGADGFLYKPVNIDDVLDKISSHIND